MSIKNLKLVVRCADYGMTDSITDGALKAIRDGILTDVGLMTNSPAGLRAAVLIRQYPYVSVGQDLNLGSGGPATDPALIPSLVGSDGRFIPSVERNKDPDSDVAYEDAYLEFDNQIKRFISLVGKKPSYLAGHSFWTSTIEAVTNDLRKKYDLNADCFATNELYIGKRWYYSNKEVAFGNSKPVYTLEEQAQTDVEQFVLSGGCQFDGHEYAMLATHCGYCDGELMDMSTFSVIRGRELEMLCSPRIRRWVNDNQIELINFDQYWTQRESN